jgi:hypothetical protein
MRLIPARNTKVPRKGKDGIFAANELSHDLFLVQGEFYGLLLR